MAFLFPSYWSASPTTTAAQPTPQDAQTPLDEGHDATPAAPLSQAAGGAADGPRTTTPTTTEAEATAGAAGAPTTTPPLVHRAMFNEDSTCVVVVPVEQTSFEIYRVCEREHKLKLGFSFQEKVQNNNNNNNNSANRFGLATMMRRSNIVAFVGDGENNPKSPPNNRVIIMDLKNGDSMCELPATEAVLNVQLLMNKFIVVTTASYTQLFNFNTTASLRKWDTQPNPTGALAVSGDERNAVIAFPGRETGHVQVVYLDNLDEQMDLHPHTSEVRALVMSRDGKRLASASSRGTVVNVFELNREAAQPPPLRALRRGRRYAQIANMCFSHDDGSFLCASSDHHTIHVWDLRRPAPSYQGTIYKGEKSFGQFSSPYSSTVCGFSPHAPVTIYALSTTGHMLALRLNTDNGAIEKIAESGTKELTASTAAAPQGTRPATPAAAAAGGEERPPLERQ